MLVVACAGCPVMRRCRNQYRRRYVGNGRQQGRWRKPPYCVLETRAKESLELFAMNEGRGVEEGDEAFPEFSPPGQKFMHAVTLPI